MKSSCVNEKLENPRFGGLCFDRKFAFPALQSHVSRGADEEIDYNAQLEAAIKANAKAQAPATAQQGNAKAQAQAQAQKQKAKNKQMNFSFNLPS